MEKKKTQDEIVAEMMKKGKPAEEMIQEFLGNQGIPEQQTQSEFQKWVSEELDQIKFKSAEVKFDSGPIVEREFNFGDEPELTKVLIEAEAMARSHD